MDQVTETDPHDITELVSKPNLIDKLLSQRNIHDAEPLVLEEVKSGRDLPVAIGLRETPQNFILGLFEKLPGSSDVLPIGIMVLYKPETFLGSQPHILVCDNTVPLENDLRVGNSVQMDKYFALLLNDRRYIGSRAAITTSLGEIYGSRTEKIQKILGEQHGESEVSRKLKELLAQKDESPPGVKEYIPPHADKGLAKQMILVSKELAKKLNYTYLELAHCNSRLQRAVESLLKSNMIQTASINRRNPPEPVDYRIISGFKSSL